MAGIIAAIVTSPMIEPLFGYMMSNNKNHDDGLFTKQKQISGSFPQASITITSTDCGVTGATLSKEYASPEIGGKGKIPSISWTAPASKDVAEYLVVCEDPDAPMKEPIVHGVYYGIPASKTTVTEADLQAAGGEEKKVKGGFWYGQNRRGNVFIPPRPIKNHGPHRYFFSVVALSERLDGEKLRREVKEKGSGVSTAQILEAVDGKVLSWGEWVGSYENK